MSLASPKRLPRGLEKQVECYMRITLLPAYAFQLLWFSSWREHEREQEMQGEGSSNWAITCSVHESDIICSCSKLQVPYWDPLWSNHVINGSETSTKL